VPKQTGVSGRLLQPVLKSYAAPEFPGDAAHRRRQFFRRRLLDLRHVRLNLLTAYQAAHVAYKEDD